MYTTVSCITIYGSTVFVGIAVVDCLTDLFVHVQCVHEKADVVHVHVHEIKCIVHIHVYLQCTCLYLYMHPGCDVVCKLVHSPVQRSAYT